MLRRMKNAWVLLVLPMLLLAGCDPLGELGGGLGDLGKKILGELKIVVVPGNDNVSFMFDSDDYGTMKDGTKLTADDVKVVVYNSMTETTAEGLKSKGDSISSDMAGFEIDGHFARLTKLSPGVKYYYLVVFIHPEDETITFESEVGSFSTLLAVPPGQPTNLVEKPARTEVTITFNAPGDLGVRSDGKTQVSVGQIPFFVYYSTAQINSVHKFIMSKNVSSWSSDEARQTLSSGENTVHITGLTSRTTYYYTVVLENPESAGVFSASDIGMFTTTEYSPTTGDLATAPTRPTVVLYPGPTYVAIYPRCNNLGTKNDGTAISEDEIEITAYYAAGENLTAEQLKGSNTYVSNRSKGQEFKLNDSTPIYITGLKSGTVYCYLIVLTHPENSALTAETPVDSFTTTLAVAPGVPTGINATAETDSATIIFTAPTDTGKKKDGSDIPVGELLFKLYYATSLDNSPETDLDKAQWELRRKGKSWSNSDTNQSMVSGVNRIKLTGLTSDKKYYYVLWLRHPEASNIESRSEIMSFTTNGDSTSNSHPTAPMAPEVVDTRIGSESLFLQIAATGLGTKRDGTPVAEDEIKMMLYYAKADGETMTAEALKESTTYLSSSNKEDSIQFGFPPTMIPGLTPGTKYYYLIVLIHPEDDSLTAESSVNSFTTIKATSPGVATGLSATTTDTTATITFTAPTATGLKADGKTAVLVGELLFAVRYYKSSVNLEENPESEMFWLNKKQEQQQQMVVGQNTVTLLDLSPNTEYSYQVRIANPDSEVEFSQTESMTFTTKATTQ